MTAIKTFKFVQSAKKGWPVIVEGHSIGGAIGNYMYDLYVFKDEGGTPWGFAYDEKSDMIREFVGRKLKPLPKDWASQLTEMIQVIPQETLLKDILAGHTTALYIRRYYERNNPL